MPDHWTRFPAPGFEKISQASEKSGVEGKTINASHFLNCANSPQTGMDRRTEQKPACHDAKDQFMGKAHVSLTDW